MENTVLWHYRIPRGAEFDAEDSGKLARFRDRLR